MNSLAKFLMLTVLLISFTCKLNGYSQSTGSNVYKKNYKAHRITPHNLSIKNRAIMCETSNDCPKYRYCCEIIHNTFNVCCNDPMKSVENKRPVLMPIPVPIEEYYNY